MPQHNSYASRLGTAACGAFFGLLIFLAAVPVIFWGEHDVVAQHAALDEVSNLLHAPGVGDDSRPVYIAGPMTVDQGALDPVYGVYHDRALIVDRGVEAYQVVESKRTVSGGRGSGTNEKVVEYSYGEQWASELVDSSKFHQANYRSVNRGAWRVKPTTFGAEGARIGGYRVPVVKAQALGRSVAVDVTSKGASALGHMIEAAAQQSVDVAHVRALTAQQAKPVKDLIASASASAGSDPNANNNDGKTNNNGHQGAGAVTTASGLMGELAQSKAVAAALSDLTLYDRKLYSGTGTPEEPAVGDNRVQWTLTLAPDSATAIGKLQGDLIVPYQTANGRSIYLLQAGTRTPAAMLDDAHSDADIGAMLVRIIAWLMLVFGLFLVFQPLVVAPQLVPVVGTLVSKVAACGALLASFVIGTGVGVIALAIAWLTARPVLSVSVIIAVAGAWYALSSRVRGAPAVAATQAAGSEESAALLQQARSSTSARTSHNNGAATETEDPTPNAPASASIRQRNV